MEKDLKLALAWLGLDQYCERFVQAGFDSWEMLLEITEEDLEVLDVVLGHRRKLQKEIHNIRARETAQQKTRAIQQQEGHGAQQQLSTNACSSLTAEQPDSITANAKIPMKRDYRHHPKSDPHAPKRPYSAYVLFSNHIRERLAPENLEFPEISRQVGQRWQALSAEEKDGWKRRAQGPKDKYKEEVARYSGTTEHSEYKQYLDDFQAKQASKHRRDGRAMVGGSQASPIMKGSVNENPAPESTSAGTGRIFGDSYESMTSNEAPHGGMSGVEISGSLENKAPIQRLRKQRSVKEVMDHRERKAARSKQACETCRQKKTKCNEERPTCGHCLELNAECHYSSGKESKDKRRFNELSRKLAGCQKVLLQIRPQLQSSEQILVQKVLDMPPDLNPNARRSLTQQAPCNIDACPNSPDDAEFFSDDTPGMGLMEASGHLNNDDYAPKGIGIQPGAFAGQSSDAQWVRRLTSELNREENGLRQSQHPMFPSSAQHNIFAEDNETMAVGNNVDPFEVPIKTTADALVDGYFRTVHASFPILRRSLFMRQYNELRVIWHKPVDYEDRIFVTTLQLIFAIGAVHARLSGSIEVSDDRDHILYFARARMLAVDSGSFNDQVHLGQAQVFGLGAMYCLVTDQMNRAWIASGCAIRSAQSLGLHLRDITPSVSKADKEYHSRIWFALLSFERTLGVMSGRPSMVQDWDCNVTLPPPESADPASPSNFSEGSYVLSSPKEGELNSQTSRVFSNSISEGSHTSSPDGKISSHNQSLIEAIYFNHDVELSRLAHEAVSQLYSPAIRQYRWSEIQALIDDYDDRLTTWKTNLEPPFGGLTHDFVSDPGHSALSIALTIQFHCVRAIVNHPCLYRRERTALRQPKFTAVSRCIGSARAVIDLVSTSPAAALIHQGPKWWLLLHHTKRALTMVLLELAFRAEHMPSKAEELLAEAKKALAWLRKMAQTSKIAEDIWRAMSCLFVKAARRVGVDAGNGFFSDNPTEQPEGWPQHSSNDSISSHQDPIPITGFLQSRGPSPMHFGMSTDSTAFGPFLPHNIDRFWRNQDPVTYQTFVELKAFDQFSFDPITTGQGDMQSSYPPYHPEVIGGPISHPQPHSSSAMPHGHYPSTIPQLPNHQQHHRGRGIRAEGYLMDDQFGFDPGKSF